MDFDRPLFIMGVKHCHKPPREWCKLYTTYKNIEIGYGLLLFYQH
jgi:hypothetical protein